jgi:hypothetical protein
MVKAVRSFTLVAALALAVVPALSAENTGTDPKPRRVEVTQRSLLEQLRYELLSFLGL